MEGYIKLHRQLLESVYFSNPNQLKIWVWCLLKANHKKKIVPLKTGKGFISVQVNRGQFLFGRHKAEEELCLDGSMIYRILKKFEEDKAILIQSNNQYSIITICNYDTYNYIEEKSEQPMNNQRTTDEQPMNTTNNDNNEKNDNKEESNTVGLPASAATVGALSPQDKCRLFIEKFNTLRKTAKGKDSSYQPTAKICSSLNSRLKNYKANDLVTVLKRAIKDDYHVKTKNKHLTPPYILREDIIERYLNQ